MYNQGYNLNYNPFGGNSGYFGSTGAAGAAQGAENYDPSAYGQQFAGWHWQSQSWWQQSWYSPQAQWQHFQQQQQQNYDYTSQFGGSQTWQHQQQQQSWDKNNQYGSGLGGKGFQQQLQKGQAFSKSNPNDKLQTQQQQSDQIQGGITNAFPSTGNTNTKSQGSSSSSSSTFAFPKSGQTLTSSGKGKPSSSQTQSSDLLGADLASELNEWKQNQSQSFQFDSFKGKTSSSSSSSSSSSAYGQGLGSSSSSSSSSSSASLKRMAADPYEYHPNNSKCGGQWYSKNTNQSNQKRPSKKERIKMSNEQIKKEMTWEKKKLLKRLFRQHRSEVMRGYFDDLSLIQTERIYEIRSVPKECVVPFQCLNWRRGKGKVCKLGDKCPNALDHVDETDKQRGIKFKKGIMVVNWVNQEGLENWFDYEQNDYLLEKRERDRDRDYSREDGSDQDGSSYWYHYQEHNVAKKQFNKAFDKINEKGKYKRAPGSESIPVWLKMITNQHHLCTNLCKYVFDKEYLGLFIDQLEPIYDFENQNIVLKSFKDMKIKLWNKETRENVRLNLLQSDVLKFNPKQCLSWRRLGHCKIQKCYDEARLMNYNYQPGQCQEVLEKAFPAKYRGARRDPEVAKTLFRPTEPYEFKPCPYWYDHVDETKSKGVSLLQNGTNFEFLRKIIEELIVEDKGGDGKDRDVLYPLGKWPKHHPGQPNLKKETRKEKNKQRRGGLSLAKLYGFHIARGNGIYVGGDWYDYQNKIYVDVGDSYDQSIQQLNKKELPKWKRWFQEMAGQIAGWIEEMRKTWMIPVPLHKYVIDIEYYKNKVDRLQPIWSDSVPLGHGFIQQAQLKNRDNPGSIIDQDRIVSFKPNQCIPWRKQGLCKIQQGYEDSLQARYNPFQQNEKQADGQCRIILDKLFVTTESQEKFFKYPYEFLPCPYVNDHKGVKGKGGNQGLKLDRELTNMDLLVELIQEQVVLEYGGNRDILDGAWLVQGKHQKKFQGRVDAVLDQQTQKRVQKLQWGKELTMQERKCEFN